MSGRLARRRGPGRNDRRWAADWLVRATRGSGAHRDPSGPGQRQTHPGARPGLATPCARRLPARVRRRLRGHRVQPRRPRPTTVSANTSGMSHTLRSVELLLARLPLVRPFTTSSHTKDHLDHILIHVTDQDGAEGWGECASASDPYYCSETSEISWHILRDFLIP